MAIHLLKDLAVQSEKENKSIFEVVLEDDMKDRQVTREMSFEKMRGMYLAMKQADQSYDGNLKSQSGVAGGDGKILEEYFSAETPLVGEFAQKIMIKAIKMGESNACMKRIVAAPTAGSCGVIPAVLLSYSELHDVSEDRLVEALYVTAGIGSVIAENASIAGASGGCQAEIGSASAMAAAALVYLEGGDSDSCIHAAAIAIKSMLGLVCDPVAGLVEVPCIKRNVMGAVNAVTSAQMALAGIKSVIPPDEVIDAMRRVGNLIPAGLKETSQEGLAVTPTGLAIAKQLTSNNT